MMNCIASSIIQLRILLLDICCYHNTYNIQVQVKTGDTWELYHGFNSLSDDYAYTNAMEAASRAIAKVAKEKASTLFAEKV